jgi:hypothetical protein
MIKNIYDIFKENDVVLQRHLGKYVKDNWFLIMLDEPSQARFYNKKYAPIKAEIIYNGTDHLFQLLVKSIDDASLNIIWYKYNDADMMTNKVYNYCKSINFIINLTALSENCEYWFGNANEIWFD